MEQKFLMGSSYFFGKFDDYKVKDIDYVIFVDEPEDFKFVKQMRMKEFDIFYWKRMSANEYVKFIKEKYANSNNPLVVGKFLIPEICNEIGFTIDHLKKLVNFFDKLDDKHQYEKVIYDAYIENNDFILSDEQLLNAYNKYKKFR